MGVCGCGKSTIGKQLAQWSGWTFVEGDHFHPPENVERMENGIALTNRDRRKWISALSGHINGLDENRVVACSALNSTVREWLESGVESPIEFVLLDGSRELLSDRLGKRKEHFMPQSLLDSQLEALEVTDDVIRMRIDRSPSAICDDIASQLSIPASP